MRRFIFYIIYLISSLLFISGVSYAKYVSSLITSISDNVIEVNSSFQGKSLFLFGARNHEGEIYITVKGAKRKYLVSKKKQYGIFWINFPKVVFSDIYSFYSSYENIKIKDKNLSETLELPLSHIDMTYKTNLRTLTEDPIKGFQDALRLYNEDHELYNDQYGKIEYLEDNLFKATIHFPKSVPIGNYVIEISLVDYNKIVATQLIPVVVKKVGLEFFVHKFVHEYKFFYALFAISFAIFMGWIASLIFWKK